MVTLTGISTIYRLAVNDTIGAIEDYAIIDKLEFNNYPANFDKPEYLK